MSNLCRNKNPPPPFEKIRIMLPVLAQLLTNADTAILSKLIDISFIYQINSCLFVFDSTA